MKKLSHPEFIVPASIVILIGLAQIALNIVLGDHGFVSWIIATYLIATGVVVAFRKPVGTGMLIVGLISLVVRQISTATNSSADESLNLDNTATSVLGLICLASMVALIVFQIAYFKGRSSTEDPKAEQGADRKSDHVAS